MSCEKIRRQLGDLKNALPEEDQEHDIAGEHLVLVRSACPEGTHTAHLLYPRRVEYMDRYVGAAAKFLKQHGVEPELPDPEKHG